MHLTGNATFSISMIISGWCFLVFVFGFFGGGWIFWVCLVRISLAAFWFMFRSWSTTTSTCFYTELLTSQMPLKQDYANDELLGTCLCWISCKCLLEFSKLFLIFFQSGNILTTHVGLNFVEWLIRTVCSYSTGENIEWYFTQNRRYLSWQKKQIYIEAHQFS